MQIYANVMQKNQHDETLEYAFLMKSYNDQISYLLWIFIL